MHPGAAQRHEGGPAARDDDPQPDAQPLARPDQRVDRALREVLRVREVDDDLAAAAHGLLEALVELPAPARVKLARDRDEQDARDRVDCHVEVRHHRPRPRVPRSPHQ
jgi:hypothetical protein